MAHTYKKHKMTKHRTIFIPEGFDLLEVKKEKEQPNTVKVVFVKRK